MVRSVAKYDWTNLEKEYILGDYKSVSVFLKEKNIPRNGSVQKAVKGWNEKKAQKEFKKSSKTIEKVIEKESEKEAEKIVNIKDTAEQLLDKINLSILELDKYFSRNTKKSKAIEYDYKVGKPSKETVEEHEEIQEFNSIIDRSGLKQLTSALKDLNDILDGKEKGGADSSFAKELEAAWRLRNDK